MPRSFDSLLSISCVNGSHHRREQNSLRVKVNRVLHFFSFPADLRYLYPCCNKRNGRLFLPWRFSFYCVDETRKKVKNAVVCVHCTGVQRAKRYKMPNERARWSRQRRKEKYRTKMYRFSLIQSRRTNNERERERERISNPSYIVYRNNGVSFFIVVQLTFLLESVHQNGRR
jgi:hypothetical protein